MNVVLGWCVETSGFVGNARGGQAGAARMSGFGERSGIHVRFVHGVVWVGGQRH